MLKKVCTWIVLGLFSLIVISHVEASHIENACGDFGTIFQPQQQKTFIVHFDKFPRLAERNVTVYLAHQVYDVNGKQISDGEYQLKHGLRSIYARFEVRIPDNQPMGWFNVHIQVLAKNKDGILIKRLAKTQIGMAVVPPLLPRIRRRLISAWEFPGEPHCLRSTNSL